MIPIIIAFGIAFIVYRFNKELKEGYASAGRAAAPLRSKIFPVPPIYREILQKYFPFYRELDIEAKEKFAQKVCQFVYRKRMSMNFLPWQSKTFLSVHTGLKRRCRNSIRY